MTIDEAVAFVARADVNNDTFIDLEEWLPTDLAPVWTGDVDELDARETRAWLADSGFDTDGDGRLSERVGPPRSLTMRSRLRGPLAHHALPRPRGAACGVRVFRCAVGI